MFHPASRLEQPKEVLDAPALQVIADDLDRGLWAVHIDTGQQEPLNRLLAGRRAGLAHMDHRDRDWLGALDGSRQDQLAVADLGTCDAATACRASLPAA